MGGRGAGARKRRSEQRGAETDPRGERISQSGCFIHRKTEEAGEGIRPLDLGPERLLLASVCLEP